ncbi:hypothetical protein [Haladaptatus sp. DYF46]|uniref:hypothetical protein n=1 Tax=Haladaptatus sp. DYF46 TaxID=2886041 RepID=UPI001E42FCB2|nr:hypothetical protein [Haladaptatus sp. DYF46]
MTEITHTCPIEGCDYGDNEEKSLAAVRSHINASSDGDHDWSALKPTVEAQAADSDQDDQADQQPEDDTDDAMPTDTEYDQQHSQQKGGDGSAPSDQDTTSSSGGFLPKMNTQTMAMLVGFVVLCVLLYAYLNKDDGDEQRIEATTEDDDRAEPTTTSGSVGIIE